MLNEYIKRKSMRTITKYCLVFIIGMIISKNIFSFTITEVTYTATTMSGTNPKIRTGSVLNTQADNSITGWTKLASVTASATSNNWSGNITLPFAFTYFGESVTTCKVSLNGLLTFNTSATALPSGDNVTFPSYNIPTKTIAAFWDKFTVQAPTGTNDFIYYRSFGVAPNRQFWIKWTSFEIGGSSANLAANDVCFAAVFEETTHNIYLVDMYKGTPTSLSLSGTIGLQNDPYAYMQYTSKTALTSSTTAYTNNSFVKYAPIAVTTPSSEDTLTYNSSGLRYCTSYATKRKLYPATLSSCMTAELQDAKLYVKVDLGNDYEYGQQNTFPDSAGAEVTIKGFNSSASQIFEATARLVINQNDVEKVYVINIDNFTYSSTSYSFSDIFYFSYSIIDYESSTNSNVNSDLQLQSWIETEYTYDVNTSPYDVSTMITLSTPSAVGNQYLFKWKSVCDAPKFQFQLMRLFNTDFDYKRDVQYTAGIIDWNKALNLYIENGDTAITLHLTEGTGYYAWRVRPIGTYYDGDEANDKNWGVWSSGYAQNDIYDLKPTSILSSDEFYVSQFDNEKNWIYNRVFTEDNAIGESITYANGLGQVRQTQRHLQTDGFILAGTQLYDYAGRGALQSLSAPVSQDYFSYQDKLVTTDAVESKLYRAKDFDSTDTYNNPAQMLGGDIASYYSDNNTDLTIPNSGGYPFSRNRYYADGTNRPKEMSSPGSVFRIGSTESGEDRTIKIYYSSVADDELTRIFGDEAYADTAVSKSVQVDPNKGISGSYRTVEGTTIASFLVDDGDNALLEDLDVNSFNVADTIDGNTSVSAYSYVKEKGFIMNMPTTLWVTYTLSPSEIEAECGTYCSTCDYSVYGYIKNATEDIVIWDTTITVIASECAVGTTYSFSHSESIDPASYTVGRMVTLYNENETSGDTYYEEHQDTMTAIMDEHIEEYIAEAYALLEADDVDGFYQFLIDHGYATQTQIDNEEDVVIETGCCTFTIPVEACPPHPCDDGTPDFEGVLYSFWEDQYGNAFQRYSRESSVFNYPDNATLNEGTVTLSIPSTPRVVMSGGCGNNLSVRIDYTKSDGSSGQFNFGSWCLDGYAIGSTTDLLDAISYVLIDTLNDLYVANETWPYWFSIDYTAGSISFYPNLETSIFTGVVEGSVYINLPNYDVDMSAATFNYTATGDYPYGIGAFNELISNMIEDGYPCDTLYDYWYALCSSWPTLQFDSVGNENDFNLVEAFLETVGRMYGDTSLHAYGTDADPGYITHAHKVVYYNEGTCSDCEDNYDFATLLADNSYDDTRLEEDTLKSWEQFVQCTQGDCTGDITTELSELGTEYDFSECDGTDAVACAEAMIAMIADSCYSLCDARRESFETQIRAEYAAEGIAISEDEVICLTEALIAECESGCGLSIFSHEEDTTGDGVTDVTVIDSVGSTLEIQAMSESLAYTFDLKIPTDSTCEDMGYKTISYSMSVSEVIGDVVVEELNANLQEFLGKSIDNDTIIYGAHISYGTAQIYAENGFSADPYNCVYSFLVSIASSYKVDSTSYFYLSGTSIYLHYYYETMLAAGGIVRGELDVAVISLKDCNVVWECGPLCFKWVAPTLDSSNYTVEIETCEESAAEYLMGIIDGQKDDCKEYYVDAIADAYETNCAASSNINDVLVAGYTLGYHHYTLFYYDRGGNLVKTVPPKGVDTSSTSRLQHPSHDYETTYEYSSRKLLVSKTTPDGGTTNYWYSDLGQLRFSQNAQQALDNTYSYLTYDAIGRVIEAGQAEICSTCEITSLSELDENINNMDIPSLGEERIYTEYTNAASGISYVDADGNTYSQQYLINRISYVYNDDNNYTYYSYDPHGNVEWLIQTVDGFGSKQIKLEYDLISGKVTEVKYQEGQDDQYYYRYAYDADNRITSVSTSRDYIIWDIDARYEYYQHGPLKRTVLGEDMVQGVDFLYTLQGWLKAINHPEIGDGKDIGQDGVSGSANESVAEDAFGMVINYFQGDYSRTGSNFNNATSSGGLLNSLNTTQGASGHDSFRSYYNGFIGNIVSNNAATVTYNSGLPMAGMYLYDEVGRLVQSTIDFYSGSGWNGNYGNTSDYYEYFEYDANGNITGVTRNGN